ncbi:hypothetical protein E0H45_08140 [Kribbella soli]|uniref:Uncharacterized protein n=1 Tax=Kribbella soli TaxID=1124743 RepID=A0A4R0HIQ8_9ACTN|nr:hypothetical protein E0H45_08140 [Kribbella soli]
MIASDGTWAFDHDGWLAQPARSASLRSTQNSLPSRSFMVTQPRPSGTRWSSWIVPPSDRIRSTSWSRVRSVGPQSRCTRFFTDFPSGTAMNSIPGAGAGACTRTSSSPGSSPSATGQPVTLLQNCASL